MADVTEVIHKITYEVNNEALDNATRAIQMQLQELERLVRAMDGYSKQLASVSAGQARDVAHITNKIEESHAKIVRLSAESKKMLTEVFSGIAQGLNGRDGIKDSVSSYVKAVTSEFKKLRVTGQSAGTGLIANLNKVGSSGVNVVKAIANVGKTMLSFTNVVSLALNLLPLLVDLFSDTSDSASDSAESIAAFGDVIDGVAADVGRDITELDSLVLTARNITKSYKERADAIEILKTKYPDHFGALKEEAILAGNVKTAYDGVTESIMRQAEEKARQVVLEEAIVKQAKAKLVLDEFLSPSDEKNNTYVYRDAEYNSRKRELEDELKRSTEYVERIRRSFNKTVDMYDSPYLAILDDELRAKFFAEKYGTDDTEKNSEPTKVPEPVTKTKKIINSTWAPVSPDFSELTGGEATSAEAAASEIARIFTETLRAEIERNLNDAQRKIGTGELERLLLQEESYKEGLISKEEYEQEKERISNDARARQLELEREAIQEMMRLYDFSSEEYAQLHERDVKVRTEQAKLKLVKGEDDSDKKQRGLTEAQKGNIKNGINAYQQLAQAAADAYNKILQAQINALDAEISIREKRVEEAKKLAEKGNVEALRIEEDRLRKAQQQKERYARQQAAVNAALTISNAITAVARAAAEGGGFGSIATIAALIAALAAGYAAVTSMSSDSSQAFADGVVDYKGKGGPRDDKNWVRISSGESIITAEGTQRNRALLEAINKGAALHMIDPTLPLLMPMLKQPAAMTGSTYATAGDVNKLEQKLDEVVDAITDNKMKQNIFFNEHGVGIMTERAIARERRRWK